MNANNQRIIWNKKLGMRFFFFNEKKDEILHKKVVLSAQFKLVSNKLDALDQDKLFINIYTQISFAVCLINMDVRHLNESIFKYGSDWEVGTYPPSHKIPKNIVDLLDRNILC